METIQVKGKLAGFPSFSLTFSSYIFLCIHLFQCKLHHGVSSKRTTKTKKNECLISKLILGMFGAQMGLNIIISYL